MSTLSIQYDDSLLAALNESHSEFENEARKAMALKLFELGRLTSGQAAEMAGMTRVDMLLDSTRYGTLLSVVLDGGEAAVIHLARHIGADEVLMDERKGRKVAHTVYGLCEICG